MTGKAASVADGREDRSSHSVTEMILNVRQGDIWELSRLLQRLYADATYRMLMAAAYGKLGTTGAELDTPEAVVRIVREYRWTSRHRTAVSLAVCTGVLMIPQLPVWKNAWMCVICWKSCWSGSRPGPRTRICMAKSFQFASCPLDAFATVFCGKTQHWCHFFEAQRCAASSRIAAVKAAAILRHFGGSGSPHQTTGPRHQAAAGAAGAYGESASPAAVCETSERVQRTVCEYTFQ